jgi:hypothetical protein
MPAVGVTTSGWCRDPSGLMMAVSIKPGRLHGLSAGAPSIAGAAFAKLPCPPQLFKLRSQPRRRLRPSRACTVKCSPSTAHARQLLAKAKPRGMPYTDAVEACDDTATQGMRVRACVRTPQRRQRPVATAACCNAARLPRFVALTVLGFGRAIHLTRRNVVDHGVSTLCSPGCRGYSQAPLTER